MEKIKAFLKGRAGSSLLILVELAVGILLLIDGPVFTDWVIRVAGIALVVIGAICLVKYIREPLTIRREKRNLTRALLALFAGVFCLVATGTVRETFKAISVMYGIFLVGYSFFGIQTTLDMFRLHLKTWKLSCIATVVNLILGIVILMKPLEDGAMYVLIGISYLVIAVMGIVLLVLELREEKAGKAKAAGKTAGAASGAAGETPGAASGTAGKTADASVEAAAEKTAEKTEE